MLSLQRFMPKFASEHFVLLLVGIYFRFCEESSEQNKIQIPIIFLENPCHIPLFKMEGEIEEDEDGEEEEREEMENESGEKEREKGQGGERAHREERRYQENNHSKASKYKTIWTN